MDRERLTITLRRDVLAQLDAIIDGVQIRNRSHAIEYLLSQGLGPQVSQAVILAGGEGVHMRPLTYEIPKALIPVGGKPVIEYSIEMLREAGIRDVVIAIGYLGDKIKEALGTGRRYGVRITYSEEQKQLGSAGALRQAANFLQGDTFVMVNGDVLADINLNELIAFHKEKDFVATMVLTVAPETAGYGTVQMRGEKVVKFIKSGSQEEASQLIDAGIYVFDQTILNYIQADGDIDFQEIFPKLAEKEQLAGFVYEGAWFEVTTPKTYERAIKEWSKE